MNIVSCNNNGLVYLHFVVVGKDGSFVVTTTIVAILLR